MTTTPRLCRALLILCFAAPLAAAEIPPYYPAPKAAAPRGTAIAPAEVAVALPDGTEIRPGAFRAERSLNGTWKFSGVERRAAPFPDESRGYEAPDDARPRRQFRHVHVPPRRRDALEPGPAAPLVLQSWIANRTAPPYHQRISDDLEADDDEGDWRGRDPRCGGAVGW